MYDETGRFALYIYRQISIIKYWFKLISSHDSLMYSLYNLKSNNGAFTNSWTNNVHNLLRELGLHYMIDKNIVSRLDLNLIIQRIHDQYIQTWFSELDQSPKLLTYRLFKTSFCYEPYVSRTNNYTVRTCLSRFRCSSHELCIEEGRYHNIARELRLCKYCTMNMIENEYPFLLVCPFYQNLRRNVYPIFTVLGQILTNL